jgi:predicted lipid-binding transport protein (Tim44 family)
MIVILILLAMTIVLYGILFSSFGFLSGIDRRKQEEIVHGFQENMSCGGDWQAGQSGEVLKEKNEREQDSCGRVCDGGRLVTIVNTKKNRLEAVSLFDDALFLKSSEAIIVAVMEAFSNRRIDLLRNLLTENMFRTLAEKINSLEDRLSYKTVVVSFDRRTVERRNSGREMKDGMLVDMSVVMNQINYVEDEDHNVVYGSKNAIEKISEIWTFVLSRLENGQIRLLVGSVGRC